MKALRRSLIAKKIRRKGDMAGKPCTPGHTAERDNCIPSSGSPAAHSESPQRATQAPGGKKPTPGPGGKVSGLWRLGEYEKEPWNKERNKERAEKLHKKLNTKRGHAEVIRKRLLKEYRKRKETLAEYEKVYRDQFAVLNKYREVIDKRQAELVAANRDPEKIDAVNSNPEYAEAVEKCREAWRVIDETSPAKREAEHKLKEGWLLHVADSIASPNPVKVEIPYSVVPDPSKQFSDSAKANIATAEKFLSQALNQTKAGEKVFQVKCHQIPTHAEQRPYHLEGSIYLTQFEPLGVVLHEVGHAIEEVYPKAGEAARAFWEKRCGEEAPKNMRETYGKGYDKDEEGSWDDFDKIWEGREKKKVDKDGNPIPSSYAAYTGKKYGHGATEITSMGLQALVDVPESFMENDPEYFALIVGILRGDFR